MIIEREMLAAIYTAVRGDEHSECHALRKWLDTHNVFNDDIQHLHRLIELALQHVLEGAPIVACIVCARVRR